MSQHSSNLHGLMCQLNRTQLGDLHVYDLLMSLNITVDNVIDANPTQVLSKYLPILKTKGHNLKPIERTGMSLQKRIT